MIGLLRRWFEVHRGVERQLHEDMLVLKAALGRIAELEDEKMAMQRSVLEQQRLTRDLILAWRLSMEMPEQDYRDDVDGILRSYEDAIALLSEHTAE